MSDLFDESHPALRGVNALWRDRVLPSLEAAEGQRRTSRTRAVAAFILGIGATALYEVVVSPRIPFELLDGIILFLLVIGVPGVAIMQLETIRAETKSTLVGAVCDHLGWTFSGEAGAPDAFDDCVRYKLLPQSTRQSFEDRITGRVGGADFEMTEAHLETQGDKSSNTVFRGFVMTVDFHQPFSSTTVVLRDRGLFNRGKIRAKLPDQGGRTLKPVGMASPKWEKMFEAYGTDQVEARVKLDPAFMERLMKLEQSVDGKRLRFGFFDGRLHVVVETPNRFEPGSMFKPLADPKRMRKLLGEVVAVMAVVEGVQRSGHAPRRLAGPP